jgi:hypothetical protein
MNDHAEKQVKVEHPWECHDISHQHTIPSGLPASAQPVAKPGSSRESRREHFNTERGGCGKETEHRAEGVRDLSV